MDYFKKCPRCGRYMTPYLNYVYGVAFVVYSCFCGYSEDTCGVRYDNKTTYTGEDRVTGYKVLPERTNFTDIFPTYILAFCPDTDSWFATNERYFFYEYPMDFPNEEAAIGYFKRNPEVFLKIEKEMNVYRPKFNSGGVYLENIKQLVSVGGGASDHTGNNSGNCESTQG